MAISRSQIKRQLRMGGGIIQVTPRQGALFGGLKKAVKGIGKGLKSAAKGIVSTIKDNPLLAAAALNFAPMLAGKAPFVGLGSLKGSMATIPGLSSLAGEKTLGKTLGVMAGGTVLGGVLAGLDPQEEEEITSGRDLGALRSKLTKAYQDLGYDEEEIPSLVANDMSEYTKDMSRGMADGGRIGYSDGTEDLTKDRQYKLWAKRYEQNPESMLVQGHENYNKYKEFYDREKKAIGGRMGFDGGGYTFEQFLKDKQQVDQAMSMEQLRREYKRQMQMKKVRDQRNMAAYGGRMKYAMGDTAEQNAMQAAGIMNLPLNQNSAGVTELDLRKTGGFIPPVGVKEKADDIPAMLSNNEFVFTADAVRAAGGGSVNKGAQRMYDLMKNLESKVV